jgi:hypothetical protein
MYKTISGSLKYVLWQCRKLEPGSYIFSDTKLSPDGKVYSCTILMVDDNWTKW